MSKKWVDVSKIGEVASRGKSYTDSLVSSLSTATQDALSELDETKQEKFDGLPGTVASFDESGEPTAISMWSNENLLRNADFRYPENQNGMEIYVVNSTTEAIPCLNDWWLIGHGSLVIEDGYIRLVPSSSGSYVTMYQDIPLAHALHIIGNPATVSMFGTGPMVAYFAGYDSGLNEEVNLGWPSLMAPANASLTGEETLYHNTYYDFDALDNGRFLRAKFSAMLSNGEARYIGVKVERGSASTLGYKTSTGWKLNVLMPTYFMPTDEPTVTGEPGKMAVYNEDGSLGSFNGDPGDLVTIDDDGNPVSTPVSELIPSSSVRVNRNMIPNWNFQNAINSLRKTYYPISSSVNACLDGWSIATNSSINLNNTRRVNYVTSTKTDLAEAKIVLNTAKIFGNEIGTKYTLSFLVGNVLNGSVRATILFNDSVKFMTPVADSSEFGSSKALLTVTFTAPKSGYTILIEHKDGTDLRFTPYAIKLEEGENSTLAYKDSSDEWQLYENSINETIGWMDANNRISVGKNLLVNADFKYFRTPSSHLQSYDNTTFNYGWDLGPLTILDTHVNPVKFSVTPTSNELNTTVLICRQTFKNWGFFYPEYTLSVLEHGNGDAFNAVLFLNTTSNSISDINDASIRAVVVKSPAGNINGTITVEISFVPTEIKTYNFRIDKIKLEAGPVETLSREVGYEDEFSILRVLPPIVNENLLINSNFANWINESGKTNFSQANITVGAWHCSRSNYQMWFEDSKTNKWISITTPNDTNGPSHGLFYQRVRANDFSKKTMTFTVIYKTNATNSYIYYNSNEYNAPRNVSVLAPSNNWSIAQAIIETSDLYILNGYFEVGVAIPNNKNIIILAMKLEEGTQSTLADYSLSGDLRVYGASTPYTLVLESVRRKEQYFRGNNAILCVAQRWPNGVWYGTPPFPTKFEMVPVISPLNGIEIYGVGTLVTPTILFGGVNIILKGSVSGNPGSSGDKTMMTTHDSSDFVKFDANP